MKYEMFFNQDKKEFEIKKIREVEPVKIQIRGSSTISILK